MINDMKILANQVELTFDFLKTAYGFKKVSKDIDRDYFKILFKNKTTAVSLNYELREALFFIVVYKLVDGEIIKDVQPMKRDILLNSIGFNFTIQFFEKEKYEEYFDKNYKNKSFDDIIKQYALDLVRYAGDMLSGDFKNYSEIESIAKNKLINDLRNTSWAIE
jgi:hypothetical protein